MHLKKFKTILKIIIWQFTVFSFKFDLPLVTQD